MGIIKYAVTDFSTMDIPEVGQYNVGFDLDGLLKQKDSNGDVKILGDTPIISPNKSYVSTNGNDTIAANYSIKQPYFTLEAAINNAVSGDIIYVTPGIYTVNSNIYKNGVIIFLESGVFLNLLSTITVNDGGTFIIRGNGSITNTIQAFSVGINFSGFFDIELEKMTALDAVCYTFGDGQIKIKAKEIIQSGLNGVVVIGTTNLDLNIDLYTCTSYHSGIFISNTNITADYFYNISIKNFNRTVVGNGANYGDLHLENSHKRCFVNWLGNINHKTGLSGLLNGVITSSNLTIGSTHGAIIKMNGNITSNQYGIILNSAGLKIDMIGDINVTGSRPAITIAGDNRPTLLLKGNVKGSNNSLLNLGAIDVASQVATGGFFKHISGKMQQDNLTVTEIVNSIIKKEGVSTECVLGGEYYSLELSGFTIFTNSLQTVYCLNAYTNLTSAPGINIIGTMNILSGIPEIDF